MIIRFRFSVPFMSLYLTVGAIQSAVNVIRNRFSKSSFRYELSVSFAAMIDTSHIYIYNIHETSSHSTATFRLGSMFPLRSREARCGQKVFYIATCMYILYTEKFIRVYVYSGEIEQWKIGKLKNCHTRYFFFLSFSLSFDLSLANVTSKLSD